MTYFQTPPAILDKAGGEVLQAVRHLGGEQGPPSPIGWYSGKGLFSFGGGTNILFPILYWNLSTNLQNYLKKQFFSEALNWFIADGSISLPKYQ